MPLHDDERLTLAGLHRTIGEALMWNHPVSFCCPIGSRCHQFKYCDVCACATHGRENSEEHDAYYWMDELRRYKEVMRNERAFCND